MSGSIRAREFGDELLGLILDVVGAGDEIETLTAKRPNRIVAIKPRRGSVGTLRVDGGVDSGLHPRPAAAVQFSR